MANSYSATPAQKPPQTAGQKASAGLAGSGGKLAAYMKARGAKPASSMGSTAGPKNPGAKPPTDAGGMAKKRRMTGVAQPAQAAARRRGPKQSAAFAMQNQVPTGGRGTRPPNPGIIPRHHPGPDPGRINPRRDMMQANANPGGVRSPMDRVKDFMGVKPQAGAGVSGLAAEMGGSTTAPTKPAIKTPPTRMPPVSANSGPAGTATGGSTTPAPVRTAVTGGGIGGGGGGNVSGPGRQARRAAVV